MNQIQSKQIKVICNPQTGRNQNLNRSRNDNGRERRTGKCMRFDCADKRHRAHLDNQPTKTEPNERLQFRRNRSTVEQHKCNALNRRRWLTGHPSIRLNSMGQIVHWRACKHESEVFRDCHKAMKG
jgi:hypothetical protein